MKIVIEYDSCWQNSVLDNKTLSPNSSTRKFNKNKPGGNYQNITKSTILGVLYRLIGDQRTLSKIEYSDNRYFHDIEEQIETKVTNKHYEYNELVMLINKSNDRCSDGNYIGVPKNDADLFFSSYAPTLWAALYLEFGELVKFILNPKLIEKQASSLPNDLCNQIEKIQKLDALETQEKLIKKEAYKLAKLEEKLSGLQNEKELEKVRISIKKINSNIVKIQNDENLKKQTAMIEQLLTSLKKSFPEIPREDYLKRGGEISIIQLYAAALYIQADLMEKSGLNISKLFVYQTKGINKGRKTIQGFSRKGFNGVRDFINPLSTGGDKKTVKTPFLLTKASGMLEILIDVSKEKADEIKQMIEYAGVSSFYLGKKGLAYVSKIK